jgi:hypothetical protein
MRTGTPLCRSDFSSNSLSELAGKILRGSGNSYPTTGNFLENKRPFLRLVSKQTRSVFTGAIQGQHYQKWLWGGARQDISHSSCRIAEVLGFLALLRPSSPPKEAVEVGRIDDDHTGDQQAADYRFRHRRGAGQHRSAIAFAVRRESFCRAGTQL